MITLIINALFYYFFDLHEQLSKINMIKSEGILRNKVKYIQLSKL